MGTCSCLPNQPPNESAPPCSSSNTTNGILNTSPNIPHTSILSITSTSATIPDHTNTSHVSATLNATTLKTLSINNATYNAMVTRDRNLTNTSHNSNSTNYSSIEQLYEITSVPHTFSIDSNQQHNIDTSVAQKQTDSIQPAEAQPLKPTPSEAIEQHQPSIAPLSKEHPSKHLPLPDCPHSVSSQNHLITTHTPPQTPPMHPTCYSSPSPPLTAQYSHTSISSTKPSSLTLSTSTATLNQWHHMAVERYNYPKKNIHIIKKGSKTPCSCDYIQQSTLDIMTVPSIWCMQHDDMLRCMLLRHGIPVDLFDTFKGYVHVDGAAVLKVKNGAYHKRIRDGLRWTPFCACWYDQFEEGLRIMQFGYCPGTTQFALKFTSGGSDKYNYSSFESRSRFSTNIRMDKYDARKDIGIEIFDMNIAEFPTMIPSYLESYDPHVILLLFDVADRSSFDGIIKMRKSLQNLYESLEEKSEYDMTITPNRNNMKRFHDSFDAIASVFGFGNNSEKEKETTRSHSVASLLSNISSSIKNNAHRNNVKKSKSMDRATVLKRARTHSNLNKSNHKYSAESAKVNQSNKNEFTIQRLNQAPNETSTATTTATAVIDDICNDVSCYYHIHHNEHTHVQSRISSMPPILVVGIQADIDQKDRNVSIEEAIELSKKWEVPYIETSAINGNNVYDVFIECVRTRWVHDTFPDVRVRSSAFLTAE